MAMKTIIQRIEVRKTEWIEATRLLYNNVIAFYFDIIRRHEFFLELSNRSALRELEKLTLLTKKNQAPNYLLPWKLPALFRRACINMAIGAARSFFSNLNRWKKTKVIVRIQARLFNKRPPVPPRQWCHHPLLYAGMYKWESGSILLKLYTGKSWCWVKFRLSGRSIPDGWQLASPKIVIKSKRIELHIPIKKSTEEIKNLQEQVKQYSELTICSVDLNINDNQAVCRILKADGTQIACRFISGGQSLSGRRKRALGRIAKKRQQTGSLRPHERDNKRLWEKVVHIDRYEAHRVSRRIVQFAQEHGASIIVFEHLGNFRPQRGKYSRRANTNRSYWLRGKIVTFTEYKALEARILTSRVNPHNTSRICALCNVPVARHGRNDVPAVYRPGAPLFTCPAGHRGNADFNAAGNIAKRFFARYGVIMVPKPGPKDPGVLAFYTAAGQDSQDGQVAPPGVSAAHYALYEVAAMPHTLRDATRHGCIEEKEQAAGI